MVLEIPHAALVAPMHFPSLPSATASQTVEIISDADSAHVWIVHSMLSAEECDALLAYASRFNAGQSRVKNAKTSHRVAASRTSRSVFLPSHAWSPPAQLQLTNAIESIVGLSRERFEGLQITYYPPDGEYIWHTDSGQFPYRVKTVLLYLSDVPRGGETQLVLNRTSSAIVAPRKGMALVFDPHLPHRSLPAKCAKQAGGARCDTPKIIANQWIHNASLGGWARHVHPAWLALDRERLADRLAPSNGSTSRRTTAGRTKPKRT